MPRDREEFLYPEELEARRTPESLQTVFDQYISEAKKLQNIYEQEGIDILVGFETEYCNEEYPSYINHLRNKSGVDYIVGSVHHVHGIPIDFDEAHYTKAVEQCGGLEELYVQYYRQQLDLIEQCRPEIVGHFDLIKIFSLKTGMSDFEMPIGIHQQIEMNIEAVISYGGVFDVNSRAFAKGLNNPYPDVEILRKIRKMGGEITLGDDSHGIEDIGKDYEKTVDVIKQAGFEQIIAFKKDSRSRDKSNPMACFEKIKVDL